MRVSVRFVCACSRTSIICYRLGLHGFFRWRLVHATDNYSMYMMNGELWYEWVGTVRPSLPGVCSHRYVAFKTQGSVIYKRRVGNVPDCS